jgi:hypothetical protein
LLVSSYRVKHLKGSKRPKISQKFLLKTLKLCRTVGLQSVISSRGIVNSRVTRMGKFLQRPDGHTRYLKTCRLLHITLNFIVEVGYHLQAESDRLLV